MPINKTGLKVISPFIFVIVNRSWVNNFTLDPFKPVGFRPTCPF